MGAPAWACICPIGNPGFLTTLELDDHTRPGDRESYDHTRQRDREKEHVRSAPAQDSSTSTESRMRDIMDINHVIHVSKRSYHTGGSQGQLKGFHKEPLGQHVQMKGLEPRHRRM